MAALLIIYFGFSLITGKRMIKMIAAACRRPGMTHAEFESYIYRVHGKLSREQPVTLTKYVQNYVFDSAFGVKGLANEATPPSRDSVTELYWPSIDAMKQTFMHDHVKTKVGPDGANFSDGSLAISMVANEVEQQVVNDGYEAAGAKVLHFLHADPNLPLDEFFRRWQSAHDTVMKANPLAAATIRRCVHSRQISEVNDMLAYFGPSDAHIYEGVASLWFDNEASIGSFRSYESMMLDINNKPETAFYLPQKSFFLYTREGIVMGEF
jgi:hypothetical protein